MKSFLHIYDMTTKTSRMIQRFDRHIEAPNWAPNGKTLLFNSLGDLYLYDLETGVETLLPTGDVFCINDHVITPDGKQVIASAITEKNHEELINPPPGPLKKFHECFLFAIPMEGGEKKQVSAIQPCYLHGIAPDGAEYAYCAARDGELDVYIMPADGSKETRLTTTKGLNDGPEYTPDGKEIWFNSVRSGRMQIFKMNRDGTEQTQMTFEKDRNNWFAHISPNGEQVVYISYDDQVEAGDHPPNKQVQLKGMSTAGGDSEVLVELFGGQGTINVNSWSPDGKAFAYVSYVGESW